MSNRTRCCLLLLYICNWGVAPLDTLNPVLVKSKRIFFLTEGDPVQYRTRCCLLQLYICNWGIAPLDTLNPVLVEPKRIFFLTKGDPVQACFFRTGTVETGSNIKVIRPKSPYQTLFSNSVRFVCWSSFHMFSTRLDL